ncbi:MAG: hypothetical protein K2W95_15690 [Candidatus Obscuribacterales bacterium]|nr:hypothetical protein [Candidatus Obscuribacterales bacterium]
MAGPGTLITLPTALQEAVQQGWLESEFRDGLESVLAYGLHAVSEPVATNIGETVTKTRAGKKAPATTPISAATLNSNLDNGLTPSLFAMEQYILTMKQYADTADVNLLQAKAALKNHVLKISKNSGTQAQQTRERLARAALFNSYMGGNSRVTAAASPTTTTCTVDDVRGFEVVLVNGKPTTVSASNPLAVVETGTSAQTLSVTGVARDVTNVSAAAAAGGWSGTLTFATATAPTANDVLVAANAPAIFRAGGRTSTRTLTSSDLLTMGVIEDVVAYLRDQGTPPFEDGFYHCVLDNTSGRQLFGDTEFQNLYRSMANDSAIRRGVLAEIMGVRFMHTTEAPVQTAGGGVSVKVRRPMIIGGEALIKGDFQGVEEHVAELNPMGIHEMSVVDGICQVVRPPLDRLGQTAGISWYTVVDFCCPTDLTATNAIIPTAGSSLYKRAAVIEHYGGS